MLQLQKEWLQRYTTNFSGYCRTRRSISPTTQSSHEMVPTNLPLDPRTWHVAPRQATNRAQLLFDALNTIVHQCHRSNQHGKSWSMRWSAELPLLWLRKFTPLCASWVEHGGTFTCGSGELLEAARFAPPRADFWEIPPGLRSLRSNARADIDGLRISFPKLRTIEDHAILHAAKIDPIPKQGSRAGYLKGRDCPHAKPQMLFSQIRPGWYMMPTAQRLPEARRMRRMIMPGLKFRE